MLVLFDIDGTLLLKASREHAEALYAALRRVHGIEIPDGKVEAAGRTDLAIARTILTLAEVPSERIDDRAGDVRAVTCGEYARRCPADLSGRLAPKVRDVLDVLDARAGVQMALVTGNLEPVARLKVDRAGIGRHFPHGQGAFGSDDEDRAALPSLARERAGTRDAPYPRERTVIVGDTPRDIACARADGVHVIGVATGPFSADELRRADAVCRHMGELPDALDALG
ncbi:MAG: family hydrolase [Conexibacter sp.]|nr:family hydrolase [Conexibacter sp.]